MNIFYFSIFIEYIGVALVNKTIQISGAQFYNTSVPSIVCSPPKSPFTTIYPSISPSISATTPEFLRNKFV